MMRVQVIYLHRGKQIFRQSHPTQHNSQSLNQNNIGRVNTTQKTHKMDQNQFVERRQQ